MFKRLNLEAMPQPEREANCFQQHWIKWTRIRPEVVASVLGSAYGCLDELIKRQLCLINTWWAAGRTSGGMIGGAVTRNLRTSECGRPQRDCRLNSLWMTFAANLDTCYERHNRKRMFIMPCSWSNPRTLIPADIARHAVSSITHRPSRAPLFALST